MSKRKRGKVIESRQPIECLEPRWLLSAMTTGNVLANPGAELGTGNDPGTVTDWTAGGTSNPGRDNGSFDEFTPHSGSYDFYGGSGSSGTLTQVVSLNSLSSTFLTAIDAGEAGANVQFFEQSLDQGFPSDSAAVSVTFQDANNSPLEAGYNSGPIYSFNGWQEVNGQVAVPAGTRSITYQMIFTLKAGDDLDAFIDDNNLTLTTAPLLTFAPQTTSMAGDDPASVAVADFNGDGNADLVVANNADGTVDVLFGNGDGTFKAPVVYSGFYDPHSVVAADLNGDGKPDIVVANANDTLSVLINKGNGTFNSPTTLAVPAGISTFPQALAAADLGNGNEDIVVAGGTSGDGSISVLLGNGDGTFKSAQSYILPGGTDDITSVAVGTLIPGGTPDIVATDGDNNTVDVLLNNGNGTFKTATTFATNTYPVAVAVGDLNGDGNPDLVVAAEDGGADSISVLLGNGDGTFKAASNIAGGYETTSIALADFTGDGNLDLAIANQTTGNGPYTYTVTILTGNGDGTFAPGGVLVVGKTPGSLAVDDLNGDGRPDVVTSNIYANTISVLLNNSPGSATITQSGGMVMASGTNANDTAAVTYSNGNVTLTIDGQSQTFPMSTLTGIMVNLGSGNDSIMVGAGVPAISISGGSGNDTIIANNTAADTISGGSGADLIEGGGSGSLIYGNGGNDSIVPTNSNETLKGNGGNDTITSVGGSNMLLGGAGDDLFLDFGAPSGNMIDGGPGLNFAQNNLKDSMANIFQVFDAPPVFPPAIVAAASVPLDSGPVTDSVSGGVLKVIGASGNDTISLTSDGTNIDITANGTSLTPVPLAGLVGVNAKGKGGDDVITIDPSITLPATLNGNGGNDSLTGGGGDNVIISGTGNDTLVGGAGMNLLVPGNFEAYSATSPGNDSLVGGAGYSIADYSYRTDGMFLSNDGKPDSGDPVLGETTTIASSISAIWGGTGDDTIVGTQGGEFLSGGHGADSITGGGAGDLLVGGKNKDTVAVATEPVTLYLRDNKPDDYSGVNDPNEDILVLDAGLDSLTS